MENIDKYKRIWGKRVVWCVYLHRTPLQESFIQITWISIKSIGLTLLKFSLRVTFLIFCQTFTEHKLLSVNNGITWNFNLTTAKLSIPPSDDLEDQNTWFERTIMKTAELMVTHLPTVPLPHQNFFLLRQSSCSMGLLSFTCFSKRDFLSIQSTVW